MNDQSNKKLRAGGKLLPGIIIGIIIGIVIGFAIHWAIMPAGPAHADEHAAAPAEDGPVEETIWTCSMHPQIRMPKPGLCPICNMDLIPLTQEAGGDDTVVQFSTSRAAKALMDIETTPVERKFVTAEIRMVGKVEYDETRVEYITAWVPGRLDRLFVDYTGVPVRKGDHMVYLYSPELLSAQEELLQARKAVQGVEQSQSEMIREMTAGTVEAAREKLRLLGLTEEQVAEIETRGTTSDHITIYAPKGGIVVHKNAQEGMYVDTGTRIYTLADLSHVWVKLDAYESDLSWIKYGQPVEFTTVSYPGQVFAGTISFIDPILNAATRTVKIRLDVPNEQGLLKPEMFVQAVVKAEVAAGGKVMVPEMAGKWICPMHPSIIKDDPAACDICEMPLVRTESLGYVSVDRESVDAPLVIPVSAVLVTGKRAVVYVEVPDAEQPTYEGRQIVLGPRAGDYYLVQSGLEEGERVVTQGNFKIDSALQIQARPSMMSPREGEPEKIAEPVQRPLLELPAGSREQFAAVLEAYYSVSQALFQDDFDAAVNGIPAISAAVDAVDMTLLDEAAHTAWMEHAKTLNTILAGAATAEAIEPLREAFSPLSDELYAAAVQFGAPGGEAIYQVHCPMAFNNRGASWLQADEAVRNPYFGAVMPRCGSVIDTIEPQELSESGDH
jgi:Cu(I)/Ag(I) efflux system membrane fusion protein